MPSDAVAAYGTERANRTVAGEWERLLVAAELAPLWCGPGPDEAYRLIFQPAFAGALVIEISRRGSAWDVTTVKFRDVRGASLPAALDARFTTEARQVQALASAEANTLLAALQDLGYWTVASSSRRDTDDGARWAIEGRDQRSYRIVVRINADDGKFEDVARLFVRLAGETVPREMEPGR